MSVSGGTVAGRLEDHVLLSELGVRMHPDRTHTTFSRDNSNVVLLFEERRPWNRGPLGQKWLPL